MSPPRICHVITGLAGGGAERALSNLLHGGLTDIFDNQVISLGDDGIVGPKIRAAGVPVTTLNMARGRPSYSGVMQLRQVLKLQRPDLLQGWMYHGNAAATLGQKFAGGRPCLIWNIRQTLYSLAKENPMTRQVVRANRFFSSMPEVLIYNSHRSRQQHETFGFNKQRGHVVPNGIDIDRYSFSNTSRQQVRFSLEIPSSARVVGHVSRLHPMKDHCGFLRASVKLAQRQPETYFILCGREITRENKDLFGLIPESLRVRFHLLGERDDIPNLMSAMDVFCLSSAWGEGFPNVLGEAMSVGLPCVTTDIGDSAAIVGDTGLVVRPNDEEALAAGIEKLLTLLPEDFSRRSAKARKRIEDNYALGAIVDLYAELYEKLLTKIGMY